MRKSIRFFYNEQDSTIHFIEGRLSMDIGFDLWIKLEGSKSLFKNIESMLVGMGEAHNLTSLKTIQKQDGVVVVTMDAEYNVAEDKSDHIAEFILGEEKNLTLCVAYNGTKESGEVLIWDKAAHDGATNAPIAIVETEGKLDVRIWQPENMGCDPTLVELIQPYTKEFEDQLGL